MHRKNIFPKINSKNYKFSVFFSCQNSCSGNAGTGVKILFFCSAHPLSMLLIECVTSGLSLSSNHRAHQRQSKPLHLTPAFTLLCPSPSLPPVSSPHSPYVCCTCSSSSSVPLLP